MAFEIEPAPSKKDRLGRLAVVAIAVFMLSVTIAFAWLRPSQAPSHPASQEDERPTPPGI